MDFRYNMHTAHISHALPVKHRLICRYPVEKINQPFVVFVGLKKEQNALRQTDHAGRVKNRKNGGI